MQIRSFASGKFERLMAPEAGILFSGMSLAVAHDRRRVDFGRYRP